MKSEKKTNNKDETFVRTEVKIRKKIFRAVQNLLIKQGKTFGSLPMTSKFFDEAAEEKLQRELKAERKRNG